MTTLERELRRAGAVLVRCKKHKIYQLDGQRWLISKGAHVADRCPTYQRDLKRLRQRAEALRKKCQDKPLSAD